MVERITVGALPLSVWPTAQHPARRQRAGRYVPEANAHPGKMLPAIAAHTIDAYTDPGETVLDPMCGIGTTLVEAARLARHGVGVEYEPRWATLARANLVHTRGHGADETEGTGRVVDGDARRLADLLEPELRDRVALVVTSPPYGASTHGHVRSTRDSGRSGIGKCNHRYSSDRANLAHRGMPALVEGVTAILAGCRVLLRPGGIVAITTRPFREGGELVDFPAAVAEAGEAAGLEPLDRLVALLAGLRGDRLVPRPSFFQLQEVRRARARGEPRFVIAHEDLLIMRKPNEPQATVTQLRPAPASEPPPGPELRRAA